MLELLSILSSARPVELGVEVCIASTLLILVHTILR
jgi:hypothetical protein